MAYCGYVTRLKNVRKHSNADRLQLADCFGGEWVCDFLAEMYLIIMEMEK